MNLTSNVKAIAISLSNETEEGTQIFQHDYEKDSP